MAAPHEAIHRLTEALTVYMGYVDQAQIADLEGRHELATRCLANARQARTRVVNGLRDVQELLR